MLAQLVGAGLALAPALLVGACAAWVPALGTLLASLLWFFLCNPPADRPTVRRLALLSGAVHTGVGAALYLGAWVLWPSSFDLPAEAVLLVSPLLGAGVGVVALALTLAAGDAAGTSRGAL